MMYRKYEFLWTIKNIAGQPLHSSDPPRAFADWMKNNRYLCITQSELRIEEIVDYYGCNMCFGYGYKYVAIDNYLVDFIC